MYRDCLGVSPREGLMYEVGTDDYYVSDYFKSPHFDVGLSAPVCAAPRIFFSCERLLPLKKKADFSFTVKW